MNGLEEEDDEICMICLEKIERPRYLIRNQLNIISDDIYRLLFHGYFK